MNIHMIGRPRRRLGLATAALVSALMSATLVAVVAPRAEAHPCGMGLDKKPCRAVMTIKAPKTTVSSRSGIKISGSLRLKSGAPLARQHVNVYARVSGSKYWEMVEEATTKKNGTWSVTAHPYRTTKFKAEYAVGPNGHFYWFTRQPTSKVVTTKVTYPAYQQPRHEASLVECQYVQRDTPEGSEVDVRFVFDYRMVGGSYWRILPRGPSIMKGAQEWRSEDGDPQDEGTGIETHNHLAYTGPTQNLTANTRVFESIPVIYAPGETNPDNKQSAGIAVYPVVTTSSCAKVDQLPVDPD